jgi:phospholipase/lecithinase/hemolysin
MDTSTTFLMIRSSRTVACLLFAFLVTVSADGAQFSGLIAFGDSLSDIGNLYTTLGGSGSDQTIYNDIGYTAAPGRYDNGRYSNGPLWVEHLANQLGLGALAPNNGDQPLTEGTDFAYAGARSGTGGTDFIIPNLLTQIECYLTLTGGAASPTALYTVWAGGNDVIDYIGDQMPNTPTDIGQFTDIMASNISTAVTTLHNAGARNFLVANLPALGDKPDYVNTPNQSFANDMVTSYNPKLAQALANLRTQHAGLRLAGWDVYSDFNQVLQNPASFGFTDDTEAAFSNTGPYPGTVVANPNQHVFWDDTHPTAPGHAYLGQFGYQAVLQIPEPSSLVLLSMSVGIACGCGRFGRRPKVRSSTTAACAMPKSHRSLLGRCERSAGDAP